MSILIKGMDVPYDCLDCYVAQFCKEYQDEENKRPYGCPLVDVSTPHGRLIDADKIIEEQNYTVKDTSVEELRVACRYCAEVLKDAPTVIESEEQEHD